MFRRPLLIFPIKLIFFVETMHVLKKTAVIREHKVHK